LKQVGQGLGGKFRCGSVPRTLEPYDQTVSDQLVFPHADDIGNIFYFGCKEGGGAKKEKKQGSQCEQKAFEAIQFCKNLAHPCTL